MTQTPTQPETLPEENQTPAPIPPTTPVAKEDKEHIGSKSSSPDVNRYVRNSGGV